MGGLALLALFALAVYFAAVRPVILRLGATRAEAAAAMPGDEAVRTPRLRYTQAITIRTPAEAAWKWLVPALGMEVTALEPARLLVLVGDPAHPEVENNSSWTYALEPRGERACRLIVRFRSSSPGDFVSVLAWGIINEIGGAMLQQPAMLAGLRRRAER